MEARFNQANTFGMTPLMQSATKGEFQKVRTLIAAKASILGNTALHFAIGQGNARVAKLLILSKADPNLANQQGNTVLHLAAQDGSFNIIEMLIKNGTDRTKQNKAGKSPSVLYRDTFLKTQLLLPDDTDLAFSVDESDEL